MNPLEDLTLVRAFTAIVECGGISAAARALGVPQPTMSRRLHLLEEACGQVLIRRDTHRMSLTDAGQRLHEDAVAILDLAEAALHRLRQDQRELRGHLRIFSTIEFGQTRVARLLARFLKEHPGVTAELGYSNRPMRMIEEGFDVGVVVGEILDDRVVALPAGSIGRYLVASPELVRLQSGSTPPVAPAELETWPWLGLSGSQFGSARRVELRSSPTESVVLKVAPLLVSEGVTSLREAALLGAGVTVLPDWLAGADLADGRLVRVLPQWWAPPLEAHVVYPAERRLPVRVRAFVDFAKEAIRAELGGKA